MPCWANAGGRAYVVDAAGVLDVRLNADLVELVELSAADEADLRDLIARHERHTGSEVATRLLADWTGTLASTRLIVPRADAARVESEHEGHGALEAEPAAEATAR